MVALLLELGADPLAVDSSGLLAAAYATAPNVDRRVMEAIRAMTAAELDSAVRGHRPARAGTMDLLASLALGEWETAARLVQANPELIDRGRAKGGALHLMAKRNDVAALQWLLDHGADPNARWSHWDAEVTPLHLAASQGHVEIVRLLLAAGGDPNIRDSKYDGDARGWADHFGQPEILQLLEAHATTS
jgi:ankyrin repeat protein